MDNKGSSEIIGYIIVFSFILLSVVSIYIVGVQNIEQRQKSIQIEKKIDLFYTIQENIKQQLQESVPVREIQFTLDQGKIKTGNTVTIQIELVGKSEKFTTTYSPIIYEMEGIEIIYSSGNIIYSNQKESVSLKGPPIEIDDSDLLVRTIATDKSKSISGGKVTLTTKTGSKRSEKYDSGPYDVKIEINTNNKNAWHNSIEEKTDLNCNIQPSKVVCQKDSINSVFIVEQEIENSIDPV